MKHETNIRYGLGLFISLGLLVAMFWGEPDIVDVIRGRIAAAFLDNTSAIAVMCSQDDDCVERYRPR